MFRPIAETLTLPSRLRHLAPSARLTPLRRRSDRALPPPDAAAELDPEPPAAPPPPPPSAAPPPPPPSAAALRERQFQDFLRDAIVRQAAPDWLPFIPGSSYWVPPIDMKSVQKIPAERMQVMRLLHGLHAFRSRPANGEVKSSLSARRRRRRLLLACRLAAPVIHSRGPDPRIRSTAPGEGENDSEETNTDSDGLDSELEQD